MARPDGRAPCGRGRPPTLVRAWNPCSTLARAWQNLSITGDGARRPSRPPTSTGGAPPPSPSASTSGRSVRRPSSWPTASCSPSTPPAPARPAPTAPCAPSAAPASRSGSRSTTSPTRSAPATAGSTCPSPTAPSPRSPATPGAPTTWAGRASAPSSTWAARTARSSACDERGKVLNFIMNDKCAAGTGRGMEVIADVLSVPIEDIGRRSFEIDEEPPPVSNVCTVFAKSEATSLLRAGWSVNRVLAAYCSAMAQRVAGLIERMQVERGVLHHRRHRQEHRGDAAHREAHRGGGGQAPGRFRARSPDSRRPGRVALRPLAPPQGPEGSGGRQRLRRGRTGRRSRGGRGYDRQLRLRGRLRLLLHHHRQRRLRSPAPSTVAPRPARRASTSSRWTTTTISSRWSPKRAQAAARTLLGLQRARTARAAPSAGCPAPRACPGGALRHSW